ncbi:MAG: endonuclease III [Planctomycetes bacterium]|nr:endonuclease III [Planctomycetota bacterium]
MAVTSPEKKHASAIARALRKGYPEAHCALRHADPFQLLVATILSAQCTDERVNLVTPALFARFPDAPSMAAAPRPEIERLIQSTGFFRNKAKNIQSASDTLVQRHGGRVPQRMDDLVRLPGVGRKTANVVLGTCFGLATGVVVDTHVIRLSRRLGMTEHRDPGKIERDLMGQVNRKEWIDFAHRLVLHGRRVCKARKPQCDACPLAPLCPRIGVVGG